MLSPEKIMLIYNHFSDNKITKEELNNLLPKIYIILSRRLLDNIELVKIIDVLKEFSELNMLDKITFESIDLIMNPTKNKENILEGTVYLPIILKHILLPFNVNRCNDKSELLLFLSEFEIALEMINKFYDKKALDTLEKYNKELKDVVEVYKESTRIYKNNLGKEIILGTMLSHITTMLYFKIDEYDYDYSILEEVTYNLVNNYKEFVSYCGKEKILGNFTTFFVSVGKIEKEYIVSENILNYVYQNKKGKGKIK